MTHAEMRALDPRWDERDFDELLGTFAPRWSARLDFRRCRVCGEYGLIGAALDAAVLPNERGLCTPCRSAAMMGNAWPIIAAFVPSAGAP